MKRLFIKKWICISISFIWLQTFSQTISSLAAERLSKAIQFPTISYLDTASIQYTTYKEFIDFLKQNYPLTHQHLQPKIINQYSLVFCWKGSRNNLLPVLYLAHYDVVPIDSNTINKWQEKPFSGKKNNGYIIGRGAVDDKMVVIALMETTEQLLKENYKPVRTIYIAIGHDEEVGGRNGAVMISKYFQQQNISFETILDEGSAISNDVFPGTKRPVAFVGLAEKGDLNILLTVTDKGGHSAAPPKETAINVLSEAILQLKKHPMPFRLIGLTNETLKALRPFADGKTRFAIKHQWLFRKKILREMEKNDITNALIRTVITPTMVKGGTKENALPGYATVNLNIRMLQGDSIDNILKHIRNTIKNEKIQIEVKIPGANPSEISPFSSPSYNTVKKVIEEQFTDAVVSPVLCIGATDTRHYTSLSKNIFRFIPLIIKSEESQMIHGYNEKISVVAFEKALSYYYALVKRMDQL